MPTYSYTCNGCGSSFDVQASIAEKQRGLRAKCPKCASEDVRQVLRDVFVILRSGTGGGCNPSSGCCGPAPRRKP